MYTSENNWYSWKYGEEKFGRQDLSKLYPFSTSYGRYTGEVKGFKEELELAAKSTLDHFPNLQPNVFFSGGLDSELILRSYINIGANPEVFIVRYENDLNIYDVSYAITICNSLNIKYNLIDFNLKKFYENDAEQVSEQAQIDRPRMLPHLKFTDCANGLIIVGHSDVRWYRENEDYSHPGKWLAQDFEHDIGCDKYNILHNRPAIYQWWKWSPGLVISYTNLNWFQDLIKDKYKGKLGINSSKIIGFREIYPNLIDRKKQTGFESIETLIDEVERFLSKKYNGLPFRNFQDRSYSDLIKEIRG